MSLLITSIANLPVATKTAAGSCYYHNDDAKHYPLIIGGTTGSGATSSCYRYDISTNTYSSIKSLPSALASPIASRVLHYSVQAVISGTSVYLYASAQDIWTIGSAAPVDLTGASCSNTSLAQFIGGNYTTNTVVKKYKVGVNTWSTGSLTVPSVNINRPNVNAFYNNTNEFIIVGGIVASTGLPTTAAYIYTAAPEGLVSISSPAQAHIGGAIAAFSDGSIILAGGSDGTNPSNTIEVYNRTTNTWSVSSNVLPQPIQDAAFVQIADTLYIFGGTTTGGTLLNSAYAISPDDLAPTVTPTPPGGYYNTVQSVTLTPSESATIYYTIDGTQPTESSTAYSSPLTIPTNTTLKYFAKDLAGNIGQTYTDIYNIDTIAPTAQATPASGVFGTSGGYVTLTADETANFYYTVDGSTPTTASTFYNGPINIITDTTLKFIAVDLAGNESPVYTVTYAIDSTAPILSFSHNTGIYELPISFSITPNESASIFYTLDSSDPRSSLTRYFYTGEFSIINPCIIKAVGRDLNGNESSVYTTSIGDSTMGLFLNILATTTMISPNNAISTAFLTLTSTAEIASPHSLNAGAFINLTSTSQLDANVSINVTNYLTLTSSTTMTNVNRLNVNAALSLYMNSVLSPVLTKDLVFTAGINTTTAGHFIYSNYPFNSLFMLNGVSYGTSSSGLYSLTGTLDSTSEIEWEVTTILSNFGSSAVKYIQDAYTTLRAYGDVFFKLLSGESIERSMYTINFDGDSGIHRRRVKTHKGLRANNWQVNLSGAAPAEVADIHITVNESKRSIK